jgi:hypothetical protein
LSAIPVAFLDLAMVPMGPNFPILQEATLSVVLTRLSSVSLKGFMVVTIFSVASQALLVIAVIFFSAVLQVRLSIEASFAFVIQLPTFEMLLELLTTDLEVVEKAISKFVHPFQPISLIFR